MKLRTLCLGLVLAVIVSHAGFAAEQMAPPMGMPTLAIPTETLVLHGDGQVLGVLDLVRVKNTSGGVIDEVTLPLSAGYTNLETEAPSDALARAGQSLIDRRPLPAGAEREYNIRYEVPFARQPFAFRRAIAYPTRDLTIMAPSDELRVSGLGLVNLGANEFNNISLEAWKMTWLAPTDRWQIVLRSATSSGAEAKTSGPPWLWAVTGVPLVGIGLYLRWRRRVHEELKSASTEELVRAVARLDMAFDRGEMGEPEYRARRDNLVRWIKKPEAVS